MSPGTFLAEPHRHAVHQAALCRPGLAQHLLHVLPPTRLPQHRNSGTACVHASCSPCKGPDLITPHALQLLPLLPFCPCRFQPTLLDTDLRCKCVHKWRGKDLQIVRLTRTSAPGALPLLLLLLVAPLLATLPAWPPGVPHPPWLLLLLLARP